ncbi:two component regulator with propeller domain [Arcicella aurantiaca]|uniref:Two component regulator with propeller domain n=1 Tax=Arcicella aurantiaca TaxID=591202 RepID=A0A316EU36_9BACT|nr:two-component regulator propeller domain-containing protein [Arcicella aurantiaca]PWK26704.1 two component regulator with propeller domain [Arcicella aurantiaca]
MFSFIEFPYFKWLSNCPFFYRRLLWVFIVVFSINVASNAQIGTWQTHFNYLNTKDVAIVENKIYCASENGFFYYDTAENQAIKLSKIDGFTETGIAKLKYNSTTKTLIIAYQSGNIDLLAVSASGEPVKITNIPLLKESTSIQANKRANHIEVKDKIAYLAFDFGLVVLDIEKQDIRETYQNLGNNGSLINIYKTVFTPDSIYLSTSQGIRGAKLASNINLQFFGNWKTLLNRNLSICNFQNGLMLASDIGEIFTYQNGKYNNFIKFSEKIENIENINSKEFFVKTLNSVNILNIDNLKINKISEIKINLPKVSQVDAQGKYWIADYTNGLLSNSQGNYKSFSPISTDTLYQTRKDSIVTDLDGNAWKRQGDYGGILVENAKKQRQLIYTGVGAGNLPSNTVKSLALDRDGQMWVGTDKGVVVFDSPNAVFSGKNFDAYTPVFEKRRLLGNETITSIAVDGGNRKWMGTKNGIFLFNPDGTELVSNFTEKNSPLPTNEILYITAEPKTGEVYIRTSKGMVSYRGTATEGSLKQVENAVKVFPNPVRPDFEGQIGIEGLVENAYVKITDVAGNLVYETRANGGTAVWNGRTLAGGRVETGIYLIFSGNAKGEETLVSRLAVVK